MMGMQAARDAVDDLHFRFGAFFWVTVLPIGHYSCLANADLIQKG